MPKGSHRGEPEPTTLGGDLSMRECPRCNGPARRVRRRLIDRLISLVLPRYRYRCESWVCRWEGTLRVERRGKVGRSKLPAD